MPTRSRSRRAGAVRSRVYSRRAPTARRPTRARPRAKRSRSHRRRRGAGERLLRYGADAAFFLFAAAIIFAGGVAWFARDLPSTDGLWRADRSPRLTVLAADGSPIPLHGQSLGAPVRLAELPPHVPWAVLAVEDRNFYHHVGVNPLSLARALFVNASEGEVRQGGSTLTQQLAKNLFLSSERTYKRKVQELLLAFWLEYRFTKNEILTLYLNRVYFGAGAYGVDAASYRYFGKSARALNLNEAAILAGLLKAPTHYAPDRNPTDAGARGALVIKAMQHAGFVSSASAAAALQEPVYLREEPAAGAPWFVDQAIREARQSIGSADADLVIRTTFDPGLQLALEDGVAAAFAQEAPPADVQLAVVLMDREGRVRAMLGGRDYRLSQFNRATQARRQPGSAFKPFVFLAALEHGIDPAIRLDDSPITIGKWSPENYGERYYGDVGMTEAFARSLNAATIRLQEQTGRGAVRLTARRMGIESPLSQGAALALGVDALTPLELAAAYAPFANGGYRVRAHCVVRVDDQAGGRLFDQRGSLVEVAASDPSIHAVNQMMTAVTSWGTGKSAALSTYVAAGKTGTTQASRDIWFVGHAGGFVAAVWMGRDDNQSLKEMTGGGLPAAVWRETMERALALRPPRPSPDAASFAIVPASEPPFPPAALVH